MAEEKREYKVQIIAERDVTTTPALGEPRTTVVITFTTPALTFPVTVFLEKEKDTPEERKRVIRDEIEKRLKFKPTTLTV